MPLARHSVVIRDVGFDPGFALQVASEERASLVMTIGDAYGRPIVDYLEAHPDDAPDLSTLVIYGSDDRLVHARMAGRAARAFPDARIVVMPSTGHVAHMEHPHLVAAEIGVLLAAAACQQEEDRAREFPLTPAG